MAQHDYCQEEQTYASNASELVDSYVKSDLFSGSILVAQDGELLFRKSFGFADREWHIHNTPETKFRIGSVTKQFTAAAILQLAERGKLKLDDPISEYYAQAPVSWRKIVIRHLLVHTSGIPSYTALPDFADKISRLDRTPEEIIRLTQDEPLQFEPGTQFAYDNTGYILLGAVIEKATDQSYSQYLQQNIFDRLGMLDTGYDDSITILPRRASGYRNYDGRWENASYIAMSLPFAAGSLYSTIDDLLIWDRGLSSERILNASSLQTIFTDYGHGYGCGWFIGKQCEHRLQKHGGGINGFRSTIARYPDDKLTIIVLSNLETAPVEKIASELAALCFGASEAPREKSIDPKLFDRCVGRYQLSPNFILTFWREDNRFFSQATGQQKVEIFAEGDRDYFLKAFDAKITFKMDDNGHAISLILNQGGIDTQGERVD